MTERQALLRAIAANLYDDTPRLAFADWLDERGEPERAEFIRVQCELEPMRDKYEIPRAAELHAREDELAWRGGGHGGFQERELPGGTWEAPDRRPDTKCEFRRGFPDIVRTNARRFVSDGDTLRAKVPTLRRLVVHCLNGWGERLAACPALRGVPELELACWFSDDDMRALAASLHLSELRVLVVWLGRWSVCGTDEELCRVAATAGAWPGLRELVLLDPEGNDREAVEGLAAEANREAGRPLARYQCGYPELFPLNGDVFGHGFLLAGRLADGRAAVANARARATLTIYDANGTPGEVIEIPLPPDLYEDKATSDAFWRDGYKQLLRDKYGFEPGFIRVRACTFTDDEDGPHRGHEYDWDHCGEPDGPDGAGDPDRDQGYGGKIYGLIRYGEFELGYTAWADCRGKVHST